jgi:aspartate/methionine/tyrosine aminotransferase
MLKQGIGAAVPPFRVMDVVRRANQRALTQPPGAARILRMEVGQPATGLPAGAARAVAAALTGGDPMGYTEALGRISLRERIAAHILDWYGATIPTSRIAITTGASGAFPLAFLSALHPGDTIALAAPYYPPYVNIAAALGIKCQLLPCGPETGFQPTVDMLRQLDPQPDAVLVASPANPTGSMLAPNDLAALATYCHTAGIRLISDEIYHGLTYGKPAASAAQFSESAIIINSFSKYFSMTGWRVGCPAHLPARRRGRLRLPRRTASQPGALCGRAAKAARRPAPGRLRRLLPARRRLLRLPRHLPPRPRQRHFLHPPAGGSRHRRHHRPGLRPRPRRQFLPPQLLRPAGGCRGGDQPAASAGDVTLLLRYH